MYIDIGIIKYRLYRYTLYFLTSQRCNTIVTIIHYADLLIFTDSIFMKISSQLKLVSAITVGTLLLAVAICTWKLMALHQSFESNQHMQGNLNQLAQIKSTMLTISRVDVMEPEILKILQEGETQINLSAKELTSGLNESQSEKLKVLLEKNWQTYLKQFRSAAQIAESSPEDALSIPEQIYRNDLRPAIDEIALLSQEIKQSAQMTNAEIERNINQLIWGVITPIVIAGLIILISQLGFAKRLHHALSEMSTVARKLHEGKISQRMPENDDELGHLGLAINRFLQQLQNVLTQASRAAIESRKDAQRVNDLSSAVSQNTASQSQQLSEIGQGSETLSSAIAYVGQLAAQAAVTAQSSLHATIEADNAGQTTLKNLAALIEHFVQVETEMKTLSLSFNDIVAVSSTIKDIADQTNLLALNAAIEAARAGESGRGFAVVADEVRKLAQHTTDSTQKIQEILQKTKNNTTVTAKAIQSASTHLHDFTELGATVSRSLGQIRIESEAVAEKMASIAAAVDEQTASSQSIAEQVSRISQGLHRTNTDSQSMKHEMDGLTVIANDLEKTLANFHF